MEKTNKSPQPHYSPVKFLKETKNNFKPDFSSTLFVPFAQERDGLGRLIKPQKQEQIQIQLKKKLSQGSECVLMNNCTSQTCVSLSDKVNLIQDIISNSFQYKNPCQVKLYESNKIQIHKKISLPIPSIKSSRKYSGQDLHFAGVSEGQPRRQRFMSSELTMQNKNEQNCLFKSQNLPRIMGGTNKFIDQTKSNKASNQAKSSEKSKGKILKVSSSSKLDKLQSLKKKPNGSPTQKILIPSAAKIESDDVPINLQSYKRWPKLNCQIEKSNQFFLAKIRQSKKLAYKIKVTLQAQQWHQK